jgi:hypothetical protein
VGRCGHRPIDEMEVVLIRRRFHELSEMLSAAEILRFGMCSRTTSCDCKHQDGDDKDENDLYPFYSPFQTAVPLKMCQLGRRGGFPRVTYDDGSEQVQQHDWCEGDGDATSARKLIRPKCKKLGRFDRECTSATSVGKPELILANSCSMVFLLAGELTSTPNSKRSLGKGAQKSRDIRKTRLAMVAQRPARSDRT